MNKFASCLIFPLFMILKFPGRRLRPQVLKKLSAILNFTMIFFKSRRKIELVGQKLNEIEIQNFELLVHL